MDFQKELDNISSAKHNELLIGLAAQNDQRAVIYVYDYMRDHNIGLTDQAKEALVKLESTRGKGLRVIYNVPVPEGRQLAANRRIHKICKGARLHDRSEAAKEIMDRAIPWLQTHLKEPSFTKLDRIKMAKLMASELDVPLETARGAITKLKQKGLLRV